MDIIYLHDLRVETIIGIYAWERHIRQTLVLDLDLGMDNRKAARSDAIADAVDYGEVAKRVIAFVEASRVQLVETLAEQVADIVQREFRIPWIRLKVNKQGALRGTRDVGVIIERGSRDRSDGSPSE